MNGEKLLFRVRCPKWFVVFFGLASALITYLFMTIAVMALQDFTRHGLTFFETLKVSILLIIFGGCFWYSRYFFYTISATDYGLKANSLLGRASSIKWDEITAVTKPRLKFPRNFVYIHSKGGKKIVVINGMIGYLELLDLIQAKAPNLSQKRNLRDLWPNIYSGAPQWRNMLILIGLFVIYVVAKLIFNF